jgi:hypothetical protein
VGIARRVRLAAVVGAAVAAGCLAACESAPALPILTDPHEVVTAAAASTAELGSVHAQVDLAGRNVEDGGQEQIRYALEADIDVQGRNLAGRSRMSSGDAPANVETSEFVVLNRTIFSRNGDDPLWSANDDDGNGDHLPTTAAYLTMIETAITNGTAVLALSDAVPCGAVTCYHVTATLAREASWLLVVSPLVSGEVGGDLPRPEMVPGPAALDIYVEQNTRLLAAMSGTFSIQGAAITFSVTFSNHDLPIRIAAPPPQLLENPNGGFQVDPPRAAPAASPAS